jgi:hypothetical protein
MRERMGSSAPAVRIRNTRGECPDFLCSSTRSFSDMAVTETCTASQDRAHSDRLLRIKNTKTTAQKRRSAV